MRHAKGRAGQAVLELAIGLGLIALTVIASGWVLRAAWQRGKCAYLTFETTHVHLTGRLVPARPSREVQVAEDADGVTGTGRCAGVEEKVRLRHLEAMSW